MQKHRYTLGGMLAILCWSSTFAIGRPVTEALGVLTATALMFILGGFSGILFYFPDPKRRASVLKLSKRYLIACGSTFILFCSFLYLSIGLVSTRQQMIEIGLIIYLWPALTVLFSLPLQKYKANLLLPVALALAFIGVVLSAVQGDEFSFKLVLKNLSNDYYAYILAFLAAILWSLYSNFSRLWGADTGPEIISVFVLLTGLLILPFRFVFDESSVFTTEAIWQLIYMALVPTFLAYALWDSAVKRGDMVLVASLSFFTPLIATLMSCFFLDLNATWLLWVACGLILVGSFLARWSVVEG